MIDNFAIARERLAAVDVARWYGVQVSHDGKSCKCPFHSDNHPSMSFFGNSYYCHTCHAGGDGVDFISRWEGIRPYDALKLANNRHDLRLDLSGDVAAVRQEGQKWAQAARAADDFETWRVSFLRELVAARRVAVFEARAWEEITDQQATALFYKAICDYLLDILFSGSVDDQVAVFREREEVERWASLILRITPMKSKVG